MSRSNRQSDCQNREDAQCIVPAGIPAWITAELIEVTLRTWQPYYKEVLTPEDAVEILRNVSHLYQMLAANHSVSTDLNQKSNRGSSE